LDRQAAKDAFATFLLDTSANANQIEFVNMIIDHLTERGTMDPRLLYESPFTDINPMGIEGIFEGKAAEVVAILAEIQRRAAA
jgi:type I restriction enzyme R subunit